MRWEYLEVYFMGERWQDSTSRMGTVQKAAGTDRPLCAPLLNTLGSEGWELTGVVPGGDSLSFRAVLKRALPARVD